MAKVPKSRKGKIRAPRPKRRSDEIYNLRKRLKRQAARFEAQGDKANAQRYRQMAEKTYARKEREGARATYRQEEIRAIEGWEARARKIRENIRRSEREARKRAKKQERENRKAEREARKRRKESLVEQARELDEARAREVASDTARKELDYIEVPESLDKAQEAALYAVTRSLWQGVERENRLEAILSGLGVESIEEAYALQFSAASEFAMQGMEFEERYAFQIAMHALKR